MKISRNFMSYNPYFVNKYIDKYFESIENIALTSRTIIDNIPEEPDTIYAGWDYKVDEYKVQNEYIMDMSSNRYSFVVDIKESYMRNKYAPPNKGGYYITTCVFEYEKDTQTNLVETYINHLLDNLEDELRICQTDEDNKYIF